MANNLKSINNELKSYINEASSISVKCKRKLVKLVEKHFFVDLPNEDYKILDIAILENSNIVMRDVEYKTTKNLSSEEELYERFENLKIDAESLLETNATNFSVLKNKNGINNLLIVFLTLSLSLFIITYVIQQLIIGNFDRLIGIAILIAYYGIPATGNKFRDRLHQAKKYLISLKNK